MVIPSGLASKAAAADGVGMGGVSPVEATTPPPPFLVTRLGAVEAEGCGGTQEYERRRDERIRENMERMKRLGILDLALKVRSSISGGSSSSKRVNNKRATPTPSPGVPPRRSPRLQNVAPISYSEIRVANDVLEKELRLEGPVEEIYTDEHEKLLGTCETSWTLFVDGYRKDGARVYDPLKGKTCHQCRQKTLGHRTHCSKCQIVQGQFCGDCLYMRYGENVLEANKNPNWICPVCRGICNCSLCRTKKGWAPTGILYKKILRLGFKSVAHFLIQTKRAQTSIEVHVSGHPISAKRSLPFTDEVSPLQAISCDNNDGYCNQAFDSLKDKDPECAGDGSVQNCSEACNDPILESDGILRREQKKDTESTIAMRLNRESTSGNMEGCNGVSGHDAMSVNTGSDSQPFSNLEKVSEDIVIADMENLDKHDGPRLVGEGLAGKNHRAKMQSKLSVKPNPYSIAGRLRSRGIEHTDELNRESEAQGPDHYVIQTTVESSKEEGFDCVAEPSMAYATVSQIINGDTGCNSRKNKRKSSTKLANEGNGGNDLVPPVLSSINCIATRLRSHGSRYESDKGTTAIGVPNSVAAQESNGKNRKRKELTLIVVPTPDSIAGRLRRRNNYGVCNGDMHTTMPAGNKGAVKGPKEMPTLAVKSNRDCIAGRRRSRSLP